MDIKQLGYNGVLPQFGRNTDPPSLLCHNCESEHTHQRKVEVFFRKEEDAPVGVHAVVDYVTGAHVDESMEGCASLRRDGITIHFECEECGHITVMSVLQHKGHTLIDMDSYEHPDASFDDDEFE